MAWLKDGKGRCPVVDKAFKRACVIKVRGLRGRTNFDIWPEKIAKKLADENDIIPACSRRSVEGAFPFDKNCFGRIRNS
jgi:hypothetical protein